MSSTAYHRPVLLKQAADLLNVKPGGTYIDATLGGGGHAREMLERSSPGGRVIGIDRDPQALEAAGAALAGYGDRLSLCLGNFRDIASIVGGCGLRSVDGALFDLGMSSAQIDRPERGFSFQAQGPLDMRMGPDGAPAGELVNRSSEEELAGIIRSFGQERQARRIARAITRARQIGPISTTSGLRQAILATRPAMPQKTLARVFQALRIAVNDEMGSLEKGLAAARDALNPGGRLVVISYHSLEDSMVKQFLRTNRNPCTCPPKLSSCVCGAKPSLRMITGKAVRSGENETDDNPRARSASLRAAEKI